MIFPENNGVICMIDMSFYQDIPHDIEFSVSGISKDTIELTAPGFGGKPYGNGLVLLKLDHAGKYLDQLYKEYMMKLTREVVEAFSKCDKKSSCRNCKAQDKCPDRGNHSQAFLGKILLAEIDKPKVWDEYEDTGLRAAILGSSASILTDTDKLTIAVKALEYIKSLASTENTKSELVYVDFTEVYEALKEIQRQDNVL